MFELINGDNILSLLAVKMVELVSMKPSGTYQLITEKCSYFFLLCCPMLPKSISLLAHESVCSVLLCSWPLTVTAIKNARSSTQISPSSTHHSLTLRSAYMLWSQLMTTLFSMFINFRMSHCVGTQSLICHNTEFSICLTREGTFRMLVHYLQPPPPQNWH